MKLEVGMYVRTKDGVIGKLKNKNYVGYGYFIIDTLYYNFDEIIDKWTCIINKYDIEKASHNIIDLIEVGDYLNGFRVNKIERDKTNTIIKIGNSTFNVLENEEIYTPSNDNNNGYEKIEKLKSIVTKEQFENMKYSLEG